MSTLALDVGKQHTEWVVATLTPRWARRNARHALQTGTLVVEERVPVMPHLGYENGRPPGRSGRAGRRVRCVGSPGPGAGPRQPWRPRWRRLSRPARTDEPRATPGPPRASQSRPSRSASWCDPDGPRCARAVSDVLRALDPVARPSHSGGFAIKRVECRGSHGPDFGGGVWAAALTESAVGPVMGTRVSMPIVRALRRAVMMGVFGL